jgi:hypothetical protein
MRAKLAKPICKTPLQMQKAFICTINQSKDVCFCLMAYLRVFVKPMLSARSLRKKAAIKDSLLSVAMSSFKASMDLRLQAIKDMFGVRHTEHEASLYWLHASDPRAI